MFIIFDFLLKFLSSFMKNIIFPSQLSNMQYPVAIKKLKQAARKYASTSCSPIVSASNQ